MKYNNVLNKIAALVLALFIGHTGFAQGPFTISTIHPGSFLKIIIKFT